MIRSKHKDFPKNEVTSIVERQITRNQLEQKEDNLNMYWQQKKEIDQLMTR